MVTNLGLNQLMIQLREVGLRMHVLEECRLLQWLLAYLGSVNTKKRNPV